MNLQNLKVAFTQTAGRGGLLLKKNSPQILLGVGIVGLVASTVLACRATLKVESVLDTLDETKEKIDKALEKAQSSEETKDKYTEQDANQDKLTASIQTGFELVKNYAPAVLIGAASIGCLIGSNYIMKKRNLAIVAAYKAVEQSFAKYRKRVIAELGEDADYKFKHGVSKMTVTDLGYTDENGVEHGPKTETVTTIDSSGISEFAKFFDSSCTNWSRNPEYSMTFLKHTQNHANDLLNSRGHVFLNEVYDMLGMPRTKAGSVVGWVKGNENPDSVVDFGIFNTPGNEIGEARRDFVNGYKDSILLDFNVDGVIYDLLS